MTATGSAANAVASLESLPTRGKVIDPRTLMMLAEANEPGTPERGRSVPRILFEKTFFSRTPPPHIR